MKSLIAIFRLFVTRAALPLFSGLGLMLLTVGLGVSLFMMAGGLSAGVALPVGLSAAVLIRFVAVGRTLSRYAERLVTHDATMKVLAFVRVSVFRGLGAGALPTTRVSGLLGRLTSDVDALDALYLRLSAPVVVSVIATVMLTIGLAALSPWLAMAVMVPVLAAAVVVPVILGYAGARDARLKAYALDALRLRLVDLDRAQAELAMAGRLKEQLDLVEGAAERCNAAENRMSRRDCASAFASLYGGQMALSLALGAAGLLVRQGLIVPGVGLVAVFAAFAALEPFAGLRNGLRDLGRTMLAARRLHPVIEAGHGARAHGEDADPSPGDIRLEGIGFAYGQREGSAALIENLTAVVPAGRRIALIGASGSGKSTLLALMSGLARPTSGRVMVHGAEVVGPGRTAAGHRIGFLTQRTELFRDTLAENLRLGAPCASDAELETACRAAGFWPVVERLDKGLASELGEGGSGLSGGERRRLALARLMLAAPGTILMDEPMEGLDGATAEGVLAAIDTATRGRTLVIAAHKRREAELADELWLISQGRIERIIPRHDPAFAAGLAGLKAN